MSVDEWMDGQARVSQSVILSSYLRLQVRDGRREVQEALDRGEHHARVARPQHGVQQVHDGEELLLVRRSVLGHQRQHVREPPLRELPDAREEVEDQGLVDRHPALLRQELVEDDDAVGDDLRTNACLCAAPKISVSRRV